MKRAWYPLYCVVFESKLCLLIILTQFLNCRLNELDLTEKNDNNSGEFNLAIVRK